MHASERMSYIICVYNWPEIANSIGKCTVMISVLKLLEDKTNLIP